MMSQAVSRNESDLFPGIMTEPCLKWQIFQGNLSSFLHLEPTHVNKSWFDGLDGFNSSQASWPMIDLMYSQDSDQEMNVVATSCTVKSSTDLVVLSLGIDVKSSHDIFCVGGGTGCHPV